MIRPPKNRQPYLGTAVSVDRSKNKISKLLQDYGAEGVGWLDNFKTGAVSLRFVVTQEGGKQTHYQITPAAFKEKHSSYDPIKGRNVTLELPNWPRAMRLLEAWVKTKLESIAFGLTTVEEEFLAQQVVTDLQGRERTVSEIVLPLIANGRLALPGPVEAGQ